MMALRIAHAVARRGREPRGGVYRHAVGGPRRERGDDRVLERLFGESEAAAVAQQTTDQHAALAPHDRFELARYIRHSSRISRAPYARNGDPDAHWIASSRSAMRSSTMPRVKYLQKRDGPGG